VGWTKNPRKGYIIKPYPFPLFYSQNGPVVRPLVWKLSSCSRGCWWCRFWGRWCAQLLPPGFFVASRQPFLVQFFSCSRAVFTLSASIYSAVRRASIKSCRLKISGRVGDWLCFPIGLFLECHSFNWFLKVSQLFLNRQYCLHLPDERHILGRCGQNTSFSFFIHKAFGGSEAQKGPHASSSIVYTPKIIKRVKGVGFIIYPFLEFHS